MPPRVRITKEEIVDVALSMIRSEGEASLNARSIAAALGCSTQPIFSNFETMEALRESVIARAYETYLSFIEKELALKKYPPYKTFGMAYIRFAEAEKELFRLLFMRDRTGEDLSPAPDFEASVRMIMDANGFSKETAMRMHMEMWVCVHGIAVMHATSFLSLEESLISRMLSDVYQGVCTRLCEENKKNVCN
jgi:AcrR family transcriptional regulator